MKDWSLLYLISEWSIRLVMFVYVPQRRSTAAARTWLLFIFLLPWPGLLLYWLFGRVYLPAHRIKMQERAFEFAHRAQQQIGERVTVDPELPAVFKFVPGLVHKLGDFGTLAGNHVELLTDYAETIRLSRPFICCSTSFSRMRPGGVWWMLWKMRPPVG